MISHIAELVRDKKLEGIRDIRDESSKGEVRVVIEFFQMTREQPAATVFPLPSPFSPLPSFLSPLPSTLCTLYSILCTLYSVLYTLYSVLYTLHSVIVCNKLISTSLVCRFCILKNYA